jgi:hypothetical protein
VGDYTGTKLQQIPANIVAYEDFRAAYPEGKVLSYKTGHIRPYGRNPYRGYDKVGDIPFLFSDPVDNRLPAMERIIFVRNEGSQRLYPFSLFAKKRIINDNVEGLPVVIFSKQGTLSALDASEISDSRLIPSATAWSRIVNEQVLHFEDINGSIKDVETGSAWNLLGRATAGPLRGIQLQKADSGVHFAFAWLAFNPDSDIYRLQ